MRTTLLFGLCGIIFGSVSTPRVCGDQLEMQNGDRYFGKVLSVSADTVVLQSEVLGKINVPRNKVASLAFGAAVGPAPRTAARVMPTLVPTNIPTATSTAALLRTNTDLSATPRHLSANTDLVRQVRDQMLAGSPEAAGKYDELAGGLMSGKLNVEDIRREAKASADQLRALKRDLGPDAGDSLDVYLQVLDGFLKESGTSSPGTPPVVQPK